MVTVFMISRITRKFALVTLLFGTALLVAACQKVPLLAPSGSTIQMTALATALPTNGSTQIIAQVIESGGSPPHSGTLITFTTNLGSIQPSEAETDAAGRVSVNYVAGSGSGTATITAISGGVSASGANAIKILVGTAAVGSVRVSASPPLLPALGGTSTITAVVIDVNGNPLSSAPVSFSTTSGSLDSVSVVTDANGVAIAILRTFTTATVTAAVGAQAGSSTGTPPATGGTGTAPAPAATGTASGTVTVNVGGAPTLVITPPATPPSEGLPSTYTFVATAATANGSAIRDVTVNWGDGSTQDLGAITGTVPVSHVYNSSRTFTISATVTDNSGNVTPVSTSVTVVPVASPTINITAAVPTTHSSTMTVSFTIQVTPPTGVGIRNATIDFGDGHVDGLGGLSGTVIKSHQYVNVASGFSPTIIVTVDDTLGRTTQGTTSITLP
jgi:adhesin/invasin